MPGIKKLTLRFRFEEEKELAALDLSTFIFDINRIYAPAVRSLLEPDWASGARVNAPFSFNRFAFLLPKPYSLIVSRARFESPGLLEIAANVAAVGAAANVVFSAFWVLLKCVEMIEGWPLNDRRRKLEVEKLEREVLKDAAERSIEPHLRIPPVRGAIQRLSENPLKPTEIKIIISRRDRLRW